MISLQPFLHCEGSNILYKLSLELSIHLCNESLSWNIDPKLYIQVIHLIFMDSGNLRNLMAREVYGTSPRISLSGNQEKGFNPEAQNKICKDSYLALLEGVPVDREEFLQGHDQQKPWGFQQLLTCSTWDVEREEFLYGNEAEYNSMNSRTVQGFEPESCISHVSEPCTTSLGKDHKEAKYQHSGPEEGMSSASCQEPVYSLAKCKQKKATAANKREGRKRKQRSKVCKNSETAESQRMTHIAVERNRRKQMNQHLNVLKSLMPASFIDRGDQASIIGGTIDFVKELEHILQSLEAQKIRRRQYNEEGLCSPSTFTNTVMSGFIRSTPYSSKCGLDKNDKYLDQPANEVTAESKSAVADVEVTLVESHAALKILSQKRAGQLLQTMSALENLHMSILHLNITTISHSVLYSFNLKLEEDCRLESAEEIASAVQQILSMIHES